MENKKIAFALARVIIGTNLMLHGLVRLPKLSTFKDWMVNYFSDSLLPTKLVELWATALPFVELIIGLLLMVGLFTRKTIVAAMLLIWVLIIGSCLKENWEWVGIQMSYALYLFFLLFYVDNNHYSVDNCYKK